MASEPIDVPHDPVLAWLREGVISRGAYIPTPFGERPLRYFDQTASGQPFGPIEDLIRQRVLPFMANTHSEASYTGRAMTCLFEAAHARIRRSLNARDDDVVLFVGSGCTGAINRLIAVLGLRLPESLEGCVDLDQALPPNTRPLVVRSRMEHHSNDIPWRETFAVTEYVGYDEQGRPDWRELDRILSLPQHRDRIYKIGTFSAASNVTGIQSDVDALAEVMHAHGGYAFFDYAAAAPYVDIDLHPDPDDKRRKDAVFISVHKFVGGPQTPGVLAANRALFRGRVPAEPGGGTVLYTSPWAWRYLDDLQHREEGGTPPIVQGIRAGLVFELKEKVGVHRLTAAERYYVRRAIESWKDDPKIRVLGAPDAPRIGIVSVILDHGRLHHNLAVRLLNDLYGVQVRGGCMCAGTYGHDLLGIDQEQSEQIRRRLDEGETGAKPGWVRLSFGPTTSEDDFQVVLGAVRDIAHNWQAYAEGYHMDPATAEWHHRDDPPLQMLHLDFPPLRGAPPAGASST